VALGEREIDGDGQGEERRARAELGQRASKHSMLMFTEHSLNKVSPTHTHTHTHTHTQTHTHTHTHAHIATCCQQQLREGERNTQHWKCLDFNYNQCCQLSVFTAASSKVFLTPIAEQTIIKMLPEILAILEIRYNFCLQFKV